MQGFANPFRKLLDQLIVLSFSVFCLIGSSQAEDTTSVLKVGIKASPPFAIQQGDQWAGISAELWQQVSDDMEQAFQYQPYPSVEAMLAAVKQGEVDLAIGAITVNAKREQIVDFSHPFFTTGLGIATREGSGGWWVTVKRLASWEFMSAIFTLTMVLLLVGVVIWLLERHRNPEQFGGSNAQGVGNGFWWSAVTMTTVGYGDKAPVTLPGRLVAIVWMFVSVITISGFTAAIASSITVENLSTVVSGEEDLPRVRVGTLAKTSSASYLESAGIGHRTYPDIQALLQAVANDEIDAAVYDIPLLRYHLQQSGLKKLRILPETLLPQDYAFVLPEKSELTEPLNRALLRQLPSDQWPQIQQRYLGN